MSTLHRKAVHCKEMIEIVINELREHLSQYYPSISVDLLVHLNPTDTITSIRNNVGLYVQIASMNGSQDPEKAMNAKLQKLERISNQRLTVSIQISSSTDTLIDDQSRADLIMLVASVCDYCRDEASKAGAVEDIRRGSIAEAAMYLSEIDDIDILKMQFSLHTFLFFDLYLDSAPVTIKTDKEITGTININR